nr:similar to piggyBac-derived 2 (AGAP012114-PA) [Haemonchus contortus]
MEQPAVDDLETGFDRLLVESDDDIEETLRNDSFRNNALVFPTDNVSDTESDTLSISDSESEDEWISDAEVHDDFVFTQQVGPYDCVHSCHEPIDFYELYLNGEMLSLIVGETNRQGRAKDSNFQDTCPAEIKISWDYAYRWE